MSIAMPNKAGEPCPSCGRPLERVVGPAEETKYGKTKLHVLEVLRCKNCNFNEVVENIDTTAELNKLLGKKTHDQQTAKPPPARRLDPWSAGGNLPDPDDWSTDWRR